MRVTQLLEKSDADLRLWLKSNPAAINLLNSNAVFKRTYRNDFCAFIHDCIDFKDGEGPTFYQDEILSEFTQHRKSSVRGPHGLGKTALASWVILAFVLTRSGDDFKVPTTASAWRQLTKYLWPEIHKWSKRIRWHKVGREPFKLNQEMLALSIKTETGEAFAVASSDSDLIEGAHADQLLYVFDEAKAIPEATWDAAEGAFASGDCYALSISTPGDRAGRFFDIHRRKRGLQSWWVRHVTREEAIQAGRMLESWADEKKEQWGENNPVYQSKVLGEFPEQSEDALINLTWVENARQNELTEETTSSAAQDVARFGSDDSVYGVRCGPVLKKIITTHGNNTMQVAGLIKREGVKCTIDGIGVGAGVVDRLKEQKFPCVDLNVQEKARDSEQFYNKRAEMYWGLALKLKRGEIDLTQIEQKDYDRLSGELTSIKYKLTSKGQIQIEPKEDMKKRLDGKSPDMADMVAMLYYETPAAAMASIDVDPIYDRKKSKVW